MSPEKSIPKVDKDREGIERALMRAVKRARRVAYETNTPIIYMKDGKIIHEKVTKV